MKLLPINNTISQNTFKGLWKNGELILVYVDPMTDAWEQTDLYHPFSGESKQEIDNALKSRTNEFKSGSAEDWNITLYRNFAEQSIELPFTESEFKAYKKFYGQNLPESFQKMEKVLQSLGLKKYLNRGFIYNMKKFLYNIIITLSRRL